MHLSGLIACACAVLLGGGCRGDAPRDRDRASAPRAEEGVVRGTALRVERERLVVGTADAGAVELQVVTGIPITVDGRVAAWNDIPEGASVSADWTRRDGERLATRIVADSPPHGIADPGPERAAGPGSPARR